MKVVELFEQRKFDPYAMHDPMNTEHPRKIPKIKDISHLASVIKSSCSTMLEAYEHSSEYLYRGLPSHKFVVSTSIRQDRIPTEMERGAHERLHKAFLAAGLTATRTNSIFCSVNPKIAKNWGHSIYIIFVKNGWAGTVFEKVKKDYAFYKMQNIGSLYRDNQLDMAVAEIKKLKPKSFRTANELSIVLSQKYDDVLITGDSYIAVRVSSENAEEFRELMRELDLPITPKMNQYLK